MPTNNRIIRKRTSVLNKKRKFNDQSCYGNFEAEEREYDTWTKQYHKLRELKEKYGECDLDRNCLRCSNLEAWISKQRDAYKSGQLGTDRKELLDNLGMVWDTQTLPTGNNITRPDCVGAWSNFGDDEELLKWVTTQRKKKSKYRLKALKTNLYAAQNLRDYMYKSMPKSGDGLRDSKFNSRDKQKDSGYREPESMINHLLIDSRDSQKDSGYHEPESRSDNMLIAYRENQQDSGHRESELESENVIRTSSQDKDSRCHEPKTRSEDMVHDKDKYSSQDNKKGTGLKSTMPREDKLIVQPKPTNIVSKKRKICAQGRKKDSWTEMYNKLRAFYESRGHSTITSAYEDQSLVQWVSKQRQEASGNSYMSLDRRKLLNDINFRWLIGSDLYKNDLSIDARNHQPKNNHTTPVIGTILAIYWQDDDVYYKGEVAAKHSQNETIKVTYEDGYSDWINPKEATYVVLDQIDDPVPPREVSVETKFVKIGSHVLIWWPNETQYFNATVQDIVMKEELIFKLKYYDGEIEWTSLENRKFLIDD